MYYLHYFDTAAEENQAMQFESSDYVAPWVSLVSGRRTARFKLDESELKSTPLTFKTIEASSFSLSANDVQYSTDDGETWTTLTAGTSTPVIAAGNKICFRGEISTFPCGTFSATGKFDAYGNPYSLFDKDNFATITNLTGKASVLSRLFEANTNIVNARWICLPADTLTTSVYYAMFKQCSSLESMPKLPARNLGAQCYRHFCWDCTSLKHSIPILPALTVPTQAYNQMFRGCSSLLDAPELPATTIANESYKQMFDGCVLLEEATEALPITTMSGSNCCRGMFQGCTSLKKIPAILPAETLVSGCYSYMFCECPEIERAPELPALTLVSNCYQAMFQSCTKLNYIKAMFTTAPSMSYTQTWVYGVASRGTYVMNNDATYTTRGSNGIPTNWTVEKVTLPS